ncbi:MAG: UDP-N-acetylglucosamine--N-acetylmuramyl-(pentapeptide) pyrophosphoryl-UDP N-acetylglucosamine [Parcubacteria group bacterium]|nr:UDP-N-acetylglucosamine--N-acetylmuramyl-(pentapeptide) pyrophosphoryl-UDP N-acetylglucosamine [Parcubacteria group bacterium]
MKVVFTGGGTGGHFYPLIAVAEALKDIAEGRRLLPPQLYYFSDTPYDEQALFANNLIFVKIPAGKVRRYFSIQNATDIFKTLTGTVSAFFTLLKLYPDVVFSKGGYASVPTVLAAHLLRIPIIVHESDAKPGRANLFAAKYATRIGVAFDSAAQYFPSKTRSKIARTGIPVRKEVAHIEREGAHQLLGLDADIPTILILGGSSGSKRINETVLDALPDLVAFANVIHQTGKTLFAETEQTSKVILTGSEHANRYHAFPYLNAESIRRSAGAADLVISRAGATSITEISLWGKPAILIPIPESVSHDQRTNAYAYAHTGAAVVLEEDNLTPHVLASEAKRIGADPVLRSEMGAKSASFGNADAAQVIADEITRIGLSHQAS